jgi:hypothetical protein
MHIQATGFAPQILLHSAWQLLTCGASWRFLGAHLHCSPFTALQGSNLTWNDCFACSYTHVDVDRCDALGSAKRQAFPPCMSGEQKSLHRSLHYLDAGNYAVILGWWFSFFPPERFLILTVDTLRHPSSMYQARCIHSSPADCVR